MLSASPERMPGQRSRRWRGDPGEPAHLSHAHGLSTSSTFSYPSCARAFDTREATGHEVMSAIFVYVVGAWAIVFAAWFLLATIVEEKELWDTPARHLLIILYGVCVLPIVIPIGVAGWLVTKVAAIGGFWKSTPPENCHRH